MVLEFGRVRAAGFRAPGNCRPNTITSNRQLKEHVADQKRM